MSRKTELTDALIEVYRRGGDEVGYWANRFLGAVRRKGGLATAKRMLKPRSAGQRAGLDALLDANRPDLTMEKVILRSRFRPLFSAAELRVAKERLGEFGRQAARRAAKRERLYPDELEPGRKYTEGARKQVRVNAYERSSRGRSACLKHYGCRCTVCGLLFEKRYGKIGKDFIHVHHLNPLALSDGAYELDAIKDLRPVCPNCHAMLHRQKRLVSIAKLKGIIENLST
jgi:5-methylcytosine-specific restriction protein A